MKLPIKSLFACKSPILTATLLSLMATAGAGMGQTPPPDNVVTVEIRMIEAPRAAVNALLPGTAYVLDKEVLRQLQGWVDTKKATILSQAAVSTVSGNAAQIKSVRELIYPSEYVPPGGNNSTPVSGSNVTAKVTTREKAGAAGLIPGSFKTRDLGTLLNVTPSIGADRQWVKIILVPELSQLTPKGFLKHETVSPSGKTEVNQPDIDSWTLTTSVVLKSGTTVLLGVHDPIADGPHPTRDKVVLTLLSAKIHDLTREGPTPDATGGNVRERP